MLQVTQNPWQIFCLAIVKVVAQSSALDEFHRDETQAIYFTNFVDVRDVRMIQGRCGLRLLNEPAHSVLIGGEILR